jgi:hypothetical protein
VRARTAVLASLLAHACIAWLATRNPAAPRIREPSPDDRPPAPPAPVLPRPATATPTAEPLDVVLLDLDQRPAATSPVAPLPATRPAVPSQAIAAAATAVGANATRGSVIDDAPAGSAHGEAPGTAAGPARSRSLAMRGPDLALPGAFLEQMAHGGHRAEPVRRSGRVEPSGGGTAVVEDRITTMRIARDGTVAFEDKPDFEIHVELPLPTPGRIKRFLAAAGNSLAAWSADPYAQTRVGTTQDVPRTLATQPGDCDHWDDPCSQSMRARQRKPGDKLIQPLIWGKLEITDMLMRRFVGDPYASRKRKLLDDTRDERAEMGAQHRAEDLARSAELTRKNLEALWRATAEPAVRRDVLFAMWDECSEGDDADGEAGQRARLMIVGWIRAKLPAGSPDAFGADEIAARSAHRRSRQPFAPYE